MWSPSIGQTEPEPTRVTMGVAIEVLWASNVTWSDVAHELCSISIKGWCWYTIANSTELAQLYYAADMI